MGPLSTKFQTMYHWLSRISLLQKYAITLVYVSFRIFFSLRRSWIPKIWRVSSTVSYLSLEFCFFTPHLFLEVCSLGALGVKYTRPYRFMHPHRHQEVGVLTLFPFCDSIFDILYLQYPLKNSSIALTTDNYKDQSKYQSESQIANANKIHGQILEDRLKELSKK